MLPRQRPMVLAELNVGIMIDSIGIESPKQVNVWDTSHSHAFIALSSIAVPSQNSLFFYHDSVKIRVGIVVIIFAEQEVDEFGPSHIHTDWRVFRDLDADYLWKALKDVDRAQYGNLVPPLDAKPIALSSQALDTAASGVPHRWILLAF